FLGGGWVMYIVYGVGFALLFAAFVSRYTNAFVDFVLMITKRFDFLASTLTVLVTKYGFTTTTVTLGMMYSVLVWLVAGALLIPLWLSFVGASATPVPNFSPTLLVAHLVYGVLLGSLYGFLLQDVLRSRL
ncbi:MAG: hypothetical protein SV760_05015, partial [Halobacteria archaeon]|nr:hypothetical protein [Halobacteria archaeon]